MIIINFKNYKFGRRAMELAKNIERHLPNAIVSVSAVDIGYIFFHTRLKVYAQHIDSLIIPERSTGWLSAEAVKSRGAIGTLLNHSEHRINENQIKETIKICRKVRLKVILCVKNVEETNKYKKLNPYAIAYEDPVLVGSRKSITKYRQNEIKNFVTALKDCRVVPLCGAGIHSKEDVLAAMKLGCKGVLISSAIANAKNLEKLLSELEKV